MNYYDEMSREEITAHILKTLNIKDNEVMPLYSWLAERGIVQVTNYNGHSTDIFYMPYDHERAFPKKYHRDNSYDVFHALCVVAAIMYDDMHMSTLLER